MIKSMTAFGRARATVGGKDIAVEIRSVNNRFFDCTVKLPRAFSYLEEKIKPYLQAASVSRGKIDVSIGIDVVNSQNASILLDEGYAAAYLQALYTLGDTFHLKNDISIMTVAQNRDLFLVKKAEENVQQDWEDLQVVLHDAVQQFLIARSREGENIQHDLESKIAVISQKVNAIEELSLTDTQTYREKLELRLRELLADNRITFDENRLLTECAIFADRIAIDEELVRLRSHFDGFHDILRSAEPVGRRLDFLVQEINRETNTIGSKCQNAAIARLVVDIKCEIEKIREQIQNIE